MERADKILMALAVASFVFLACTENARTKQWGGTSDVQLDKGYKLVNITWKEGNLWYLVRPMRPGEVPEKYEFQEDSNFGVMNGKIIIQERASAFPQQ